MRATNQTEPGLLQALAAVAKFGGYDLKTYSAVDDLEKRVLTVKFTRISDGQVQEHFEFREETEAERLEYRVDSHGHVTDVAKEPPDPTDLTETDETDQAKAEATDPDDEKPSGEVSEVVGRGEIDGVETTITRVTPAEQEPKAEIHLVGELAAAARKRR